MKNKLKLVTLILTILFSFAVTSVVWAACDEDPVVTITPGSPPCVAQEVCAATTLCGEKVAGTYTWTATGGIANTTSGECIPFTPSGASSFTVTATDTANGDAQDSITGNCITTTAIDATFTGCGTLLIPWFGIVEIQGTGIDFGLTSIVRYDSPLVFKLPELIGIEKTTITQFVILWPSLFFPVWDYPATVTVLVDGLSDAIEIPACGQ